MFLFTLAGFTGVHSVAFAAEGRGAVYSRRECDGRHG